MHSLLQEHTWHAYVAPVFFVTLYFAQGFHFWSRTASKHQVATLFPTRLFAHANDAILLG